MIIKEHGFYHIYCKTNKNNKTNLFDEIKFILPRNMSLLNVERNIQIEMEKKHFEKYNNSDHLDLIINKPIEECQDDKNQSETFAKMNVFILGMVSIYIFSLIKIHIKLF